MNRFHSDCPSICLLLRAGNQQKENPSQKESNGKCRPTMAHNNKKLEPVFLSLAQSLAAVRTYHTTNIQQQKTPYKCAVRQTISPLGHRCCSTTRHSSSGDKIGSTASPTKDYNNNHPSSKYNSCLVWSNMLEDGGDQWLVMVRTSTTPCCSLHE